jgi:hypothetical protein
VCGPDADPESHDRPALEGPTNAHASPFEANNLDGFCLLAGRIARQKLGQQHLLLLHAALGEVEPDAVIVMRTVPARSPRIRAGWSVAPNASGANQ